MEWFCIQYGVKNSLQQSCPISAATTHRHMSQDSTALLVEIAKSGIEPIGRLNPCSFRHSKPPFDFLPIRMWVCWSFRLLTVLFLSLLLLHVSRTVLVLFVSGDAALPAMMACVLLRYWGRGAPPKDVSIQKAINQKPVKPAE